MGINANHPFEDLDGVKCSVVEKLCTPERVRFLKDLLELNSFSVVVAKSPPPKVVAKPAATASSEVSSTVEATPVLPETFTVGVTDLLFNTTNAIFGRSLKTVDGHIVTRAYWMQLEAISHDEIPYFESTQG